MHRASRRRAASPRHGWSIETLTYSPTRLVRLEGRKVAILFPPAEAEGAWQLYPHPDAFPGLNFEGLPAPLRPGFAAFPDFAAVERFLGIGADAPMRMAA
ncbi:hypothetical protein Q8W71_14970 [Methylobacterium sp. NEAU 140]|uniref:hypothetical protein n=1 Tax=Methylobacterium sp. NEAU 140 TaxID=3064945 RepID=UPI002736B5F8|nr:hypothetical protein [Methylobacterium sp. NEAU 140]MDP4023931.1 hypothetical protein [Methylobacterium sp. NEAU 140]